MNLEYYILVASAFINLGTTLLILKIINHANVGLELLGKLMDEQISIRVKEIK